MAEVQSILEVRCLHMDANPENGPVTAHELRRAYESGWRPVSRQDGSTGRYGDGLLWRLPGVWISHLEGPTDIAIMRRKTRLIQNSSLDILSRQRSTLY